VKANDERSICQVTASEGSAMIASAQHDYAATQTLHEGGCTTLLRALRGGDHRPVLLKVVDPRRCRERDLERLRHDYETGASLDLPAIARPLGLDSYQGMPALVLEDFGGEPLDHLLGKPMPVRRFLELARRIAGAVATLHERCVIHKDLKPENVLVHPVSGEVKLADLGIATRLPREQQPARPPPLIEGTLPYMSPEQTGRMNRAVDSRSDLYSLGVTFYQMLTGRLPFEARDPLEWVHCHVARAPASPSQLVPEVPEVVARIVMKLLAKMTDDRYQTARGLEHDLARCLEQWRQSRHVDPFPLGERDISDRLQIPQKLYGRDQEIAALLAAFERVADTAIPELVLVSGYSGIGKSSLVHELQKPIVQRRGLFIAGKFEQVKRDVPYSTIAQAFRELVLDLLAEGEEGVAQWRERLRAALGGNGQLVVDVIPQVELLVGRQPPVPELPPAEAQHRLRLVFRRFVGVFTSKEHPLTLFIDDLQWADPASLALLQDLVTPPDMRSLLVVGAYRDNEVTPNHPLMSALDSARTAGARVSEVVVGPLASEHLTALITDALHCGPREAEPLAALVLEKTGANPFFVVQFLGVLYQEGLIAFDPGAGRWRWDVAKIRAQGYSDNVVELMVGKLRHLPFETQQALELAASIGATVDSETLAIVWQRDPEAALRPALEAELLLRLERTYRFPHDRLQEAAYSLIPEGERAAVHLRIGRLLRARTAPEEVENEIFKIVNQLDRGAALITSREEREQVAELNLIAGKRARRSTAYASALKYLAAGARLLTEESWGERYQLTFALELHRAECEFLTGELEKADERLSRLAHLARTQGDMAAVVCAQVVLFTAQDRSDRAIDAGLHYLRLIGVAWSPHPTAAEVREEYERMWQQLGDRSIEGLIDLPHVTEPRWRVTMDVLTTLIAPALFTDENLVCLVVGRIANLSLEHGNSDASCFAYVWVGMLLGSHFGDYRSGFRFGKLAVDLVQERGLLRFKARVYMTFGSAVAPWTKHMRTGLGLVRRAFDTAIETGDLTFASYTCNNSITLLLAKGDLLGNVQREAENALEFTRKTRFGLITHVLTGQLRLIRTLRGLTPDFSSFDDARFDEDEFEQHLEADPCLAIAACSYWIRKLQGRFYAGDYACALEAASKAQRLLWTSTAFLEAADYHFYGALALAAHHHMAPADERPQNLEALAAHHRQLEIWSENCPENFRSCAALVGAEIARITGQNDEAMALYEEAIRSARENGFVQNEALAYELASRFYRARGYGQFADAYLREARACYLRWGAEGKVRQLERLHPQLIERRPHAPAEAISARTEQLDLFSVVKASQTISGEIEIEKLVGTLLQVVLEQGGARRGCLVLERDGALFVEAEASIEEKGLVTRLLPSLAMETSLFLPVSVLQHARVTREPVIVEDVSADPGKFASDAYFSRHRTRSVLCLPIVRQSELVALVYLENRHVAGAFTPDRLTTLSLLASQAAISVENARLLREERQAREHSAFLAEAGALLSESRVSEETRKRLSRLCVESLADWCVLDLIEGREIRRLAGACADPAKEPLLDQLRQRHPARWDSPHPAARCLRSGEAILLPKITDDMHRSYADDSDHFELARALGTRSGVIVPLVARGQTLGVFTMGSGTPGRYRQADLELAQELARRAASAIDNARLYREVQQADKRKSEFIAVLSHELRNPLAPIRTGHDLLRRSPPGSMVAAQAWEIVDRQTEHLTRLVDDLLEVTRISHGKIQLQRARVDLREVVQSTCDDLQPLFARGSLELRLEPMPAPVWTEGDEMRLSQVLGNLLQNAAKFTPAGGIVTVRVARGGGRAEVSVRDTGVGLDAGEMKRLFEPFAQAEQGLARTQGGLGLGLALAKGLVELHGGSIEARSEGRGRGSEFIVDLPLAAGAQPA
jgi:predicted ATPase/signal transduction histidine kinase